MIGTPLSQIESRCNRKQHLNDRLKIEDLFWKQKANVKWIKEGDKNTKFFHQTVYKRRQKLYIHKIEGAGGQRLTDQAEIIQEVVSYFNTQLNGDHHSQGDNLLEHIPYLLSKRITAL